MSPRPIPSLLLELCSLCPIEPACHREQMLDYLDCKHRAGDDTEAAAFAVKDQPYRCWLLSIRESAPPA